MPIGVIRFDMRAPGFSPIENAARYSTALEMAEWADRRGFGLVVLSEHHGTEDGYLPSPLIMAAAVAARTEKILMSVAALLVPLHDPLRLAEDIAIVDNLSGGRLSVVAGLGYRPVEYEMFDRDWRSRGRRLDECLEVMLKAWTGEPFEYQGTTVRVSPRPFSQPHPIVMVGGSTTKAAERAARFGLGFFPAVDDAELAEIYREACRRLGREPGFVNLLPEGQPGLVVISEDPDRTWHEVGPYLLHDAVTYSGWQTDDIRSIVHSGATTLDELKVEGIYQVLTPDECLDLVRRLGRRSAITVHPLCGGTPPELAWPSLELFADKVLPRLSEVT